MDRERERESEERKNKTISIRQLKCKIFVSCFNLLPHICFSVKCFNDQSRQNWSSLPHLLI